MPARGRRVAKTPEERELQMINMSYDEAERQIRGGTASSQILSLFLKAGMQRDQLEMERLRTENRLAESKIEAMANASELAGAAAEAIRWFKGYSGQATKEELEELQDELH